MANFTRKELAGSLFCPIFTFIWGLVRALNVVVGGWTVANGGFFRLSFVGAMFGGALCTALTVSFDIHTEYYLDKRLILIASVFAFHIIISRFMVSSNAFYVVLYLLVALISYFILFTKIRDENTDWKELTVIVLSDPVLYWTVCHTLTFAYK